MNLMKNYVSLLTNKLLMRRIISLWHTFQVSDNATSSFRLGSFPIYFLGFVECIEFVQWDVHGPNFEMSVHESGSESDIIDLQFHKSSHAFSSSGVGFPLYTDFSLNLFSNWTSTYSMASSAGAVHTCNISILSPIAVAFTTYTRWRAFVHTALRSAPLLQLPQEE